MSIRCRDIIAFMEQLAPASLAENWDNVGLILGSGEMEIERILLCLDVTPEVVEEALNADVRLIISHHPLIFKKIGRIHRDDPKGGLLYKLIKADIGVFSAHTNLDVVEQGVNRKLAEKLELSNITGLKDCVGPVGDELGDNRAAAGFAAKNSGLGAVGYHTAGLKLEEFIAFVKARLEVESVRATGRVRGIVEKVAVFCGSFDDDLDAVLSQKADVLVTGDLKYHTAVDALGMGMCIIDAGHFNTEKIILPVLEKLLASRFPGLEVICSKMATDPFKTY